MPEPMLGLPMRTLVQTFFPGLPDEHKGFVAGYLYAKALAITGPQDLDWDRLQQDSEELLAALKDYGGHARPDLTIE